MAVSSSITLHSISVRFHLHFCVKFISFSVSHVDVGVLVAFLPVVLMSKCRHDEEMQVDCSDIYKSGQRLVGFIPFIQHQTFLSGLTVT